VSLAGQLYLSGLQAGYVPALDPTAGSLALRFSIRNVSDVPIDSIVYAWAKDPFGGVIVRRGVAVRGLLPDEARAFSVLLPAVGLSTFPTAGYTVVPTTLVDGGLLPRLSRELTVLAMPWPFVVLLVLGLLAIPVIAYRRSIGRFLGLFGARVRARWPSPPAPPVGGGPDAGVVPEAP
jgi:hypothetical protein